MRHCLVVFLLFTSIALAQARPAQVIVFRHAEKPKDPNALHLSPAGERRAVELVNYLTSEPELTKNGLPVALFAARPTKKGHGQRTLETLTPLARQLALPVETPFLSSEYKKLAKSILSEHRYKGKTVLICWTHESIPDLVAALGVHARPPNWDDKDYDRVYSISYVGREVILKELSENLSFELEGKGHKSGKRHFLQ